MVSASQSSALFVEAAGGSGPVAQACSSTYAYVVCLSLGTPSYINVCSVNPYQTSKRAMDLLSIELNRTMNAKVCGGGEGGRAGLSLDECATANVYIHMCMCVCVRELVCICISVSTVHITSVLSVHVHHPPAS